MVMAAKGHLTGVLSLLSEGANPDIKASNGMTAADWARKFGQSETANLIAEHSQVNSNTYLDHYKGLRCTSK